MTSMQNHYPLFAIQKITLVLDQNNPTEIQKMTGENQKLCCDYLVVGYNKAASTSCYGK